MNKEEILEKSRNEKIDEGIEFASNKGRKIGVSGMCAMFIIIAVYNSLKGLDSNAIFAMFWTYLGFESYGMYTVSRKRIHLVGAVAGIFAGVLWLIGYMI